MIITNKTRRIVLSKDAKEARSFFSRMRGLMFAKKPQTIVLVNPHKDVEGASIHMFFMRMPIDVIWLNEGMKVVSVFEGAKPWAIKIFRPRLSAKYVVECPIRSIKRTKTKEGDTFEFT